EILSRHQRSMAGISSLVFTDPKDSSENGPQLIVGCDDSGLYETGSTRDNSIQVVREYVGFDLDGPCRARLVAGGPAVVAASKDGGMLKYSANLGVPLA
ncbi:hypothetical protein BGW38_008350, partial [Lunasporangiospora selenospora]